MGGTSSVEVPGGGSEGYHVLKVQENSPGHKAGLESFFDYIIAANGIRLNQDSDFLKSTCSQNIDKPVQLLVYSSKDQSVRETAIIPTNTWGGAGLLGVSIRFCSFEGASENIWHILDVEPGSPAYHAGLKSNVDYIVAADSVLDDKDDLYALIEKHNMKPLRLYVYSSETDRCREVTITPNKSWGGEGSMGCGIGFGYLHRIPKRARTATTGVMIDEQSVPFQQQQQQQYAAPSGFTSVPLTAPQDLSSTFQGLNINSMPQLAGGVMPQVPPMQVPSPQQVSPLSTPSPQLLQQQQQQFQYPAASIQITTTQGPMPAYSQFQAPGAFPAAGQYPVATSVPQAVISGPFNPQALNLGGDFDFSFGAPAPVARSTPQENHGHSHGDQPCHGHGTPAPAPAPVAAAHHGHSHDGQPCHGHGTPSPVVTPVPASSPTPMYIPRMEEPQHHGHSHDGQPCHGHGAPAPVVEEQHHGHSHDGQACHGHH